jgi:hypothetical protein
VDTTAPGAETAPLVGHVQSDAFCEGCGYNLHTQPVTRDPRLGILTCRCPECGRFSAAANLTPVRHVWLNRLGLGMLLAWVLFLLGFFALLTLFHGLMANAFVQESVQFQNIPPTNPGAVWRYHYVKRPPPATLEQASQLRFQKTVIVVVTVLLGVIAGGAVSVFMWHTRGWRRLVAFVPALIGVGVTFLGWSNDPSARFIQDVVQTQTGICLLLESAGAVLGLWLGRPTARAALSILLPPKPRQHLAFLWTTDGKPLKL